jgi:UDP-N-acetylglucosamine transferase subunit ALG13
VIFVTVGNATQGFRRLLDAVDRLAGEGLFRDEAVFIQSGNNHDFHPVYCKHEAFVPMDDFAAKMQQATIVVSHGGTGTLFHALHAGKTPVVMPRRRKYGEIIDDHQLELVQALAAEGRLISIYEPDDLPAAILEARQRQAGQTHSSSMGMHALVAKAIDELMDV